MDIAKKQKLIRVAIVVGVIASIIALVVVLCSLPDTTREYEDDYDEAIAILTDKRPTNILLYGDDMFFRDGVDIKKISSIDENTLSTKKNYTVLIINDENGNVTLSESELTFLKNKIDEDMNFYLYYYGIDLIETLEGREIIQPDTCTQGDLCSASVVCNGQRTGFGGIFTEEDKAIADKHGIEGRPGEFILTNVIYCYKSNR